MKHGCSWLRLVLFIRLSFAVNDLMESVAKRPFTWSGLNRLIPGKERTLGNLKKGKRGPESPLKTNSCLCIRIRIVFDDIGGVCCCRFVGADE